MQVFNTQFFLILCLLSTAFTTLVQAETKETLTIVSWGGTYEDAQKTILFEPFEKLHNVNINVVQYNGGIGQLSNQIKLGNVHWDLVDMMVSDAEAACEAGYLITLSPDLAGKSYPGNRIENDFMPNSFIPCAIPQSVSSHVIAFNPNAFEERLPSTVADFFDLENFPGKRGLQKRPVAILEWALYSYNVPREQVYRLLSTERGLNLAFKRLDEIRDHIVWWHDIEEPAQLLVSGEVSMSAGNNSNFFNAALLNDEPVNIIWDGQIYQYEAWAITNGSKNQALAKKFIQFASKPYNMFAMSQKISLGPIRYSVQERIGWHEEAQLNMKQHLPTSERHLEKAIKKDHEWYAKTYDVIHRRFELWLYKDKYLTD